MNDKRNMQDVINLLTEKHGMIRKDAETFVRAMFNLIKETLEADKYIKIKGLGTFKLTEVESRESVHVQTGERIEIQGYTKVTFTPDTTMKELINKPFSHFETVVLNEGVELADTVTEDAGTPEETIVEETTPTTTEPDVEEALPVAAEAIPEELSTETPETTEEIIETEVAETEGTETEVTKTPEAEAPETEIIETEIPEVEVPEAKEEVEVPETESSEEDSTAFIEEKEEEAAAPAIQPKQEKKSSGIVLWGIIAALILVILFGFYWLFMYPTDSSEEVPAVPPMTNEQTVIPTPAPEAVQGDILQKDSTAQLQAVQYIELSPEELRRERVPSLADTVEYQIAGTQTTYTLQKGETIIKASVKFFGTKKYWPYIVKYNKDVIENPDDLPAGIQVKIPKLVPKE